MNKKWIIFIRKGYLLIFPAVVACVFTRANAASQILASCQGVNVSTSCLASRQSLSGSMQTWSVADGHGLFFPLWQMMPVAGRYFYNKELISYCQHKVEQV